MKTTISQKHNQELNKLFTLVAMFFFSVMMFTSCSENSEVISDDALLIEKIESTSKIVVEESALPSTTETVFNEDFIDSYKDKIEYAEGFGYKISISTDNIEREEKNASVYFNLEGRQLEDRRESVVRRRHRCFRFEFPVTFFMPDNTTITLESKDDWVLVRQWYQANPNANERPELIFPFNIILKDGTVQTLLNIDELREVKQACRESRDQRKCFKLVLPVSFTMPDATVITINERQDFRLIRRWHMANPDVDEKGSLNYPVEIEYRNGTVNTIADETEMQAAKDDCRN